MHGQQNVKKETTNIDPDVPKLKTYQVFCLIQLLLAQHIRYLKASR